MALALSCVITKISKSNFSKCLRYRHFDALQPLQIFELFGIFVLLLKCSCIIVSVREHVLIFFAKLVLF
jgi:hypothetical protein